MGCCDDAFANIRQLWDKIGKLNERTDSQDSQINELNNKIAIFFENIISKQNLLEFSLYEKSQAIGDMTRAFHELVGKFASLERELDDVKQDFTDFRAAECKDRERECEELMGKIREERDAHDGDL